MSVHFRPPTGEDAREWLALGWALGSKANLDKALASIAHDCFRSPHVRSAFAALAAGAFREQLPKDNQDLAAWLERTGLAPRPDEGAGGAIARWAAEVTAQRQQVRMHQAQADAARFGLTAKTG